MNNQILYIVINKELKMSSGKVAAQAVHAAMMLEGKYDQRFRFADRYKRTVIVLEVETTNQLKNLYRYLEEVDVVADYYIDDDHNEAGAYCATALAVSPIDENDKEKREIFAGLKLYSPDNDETIEAITNFAKAASSMAVDKAIAKRSVEHEALQALETLKDKRFIKWSPVYPNNRYDDSPRWLKRATKKISELL